MSFDEMRSRPETVMKPLRSDWSEEEKRFSVGLDAFRKSIEIANVLLENPPYTYSSEKITSPETVVDKGVSSAAKNLPKLVQDERTQTVECNSVQGPYVGSSTPQPARPTQQESVLSLPEIDPFDESASTKTDIKVSDDLFDFRDKPITKPVVVEQKPAPQPKAETKTVDPFDEFVAPSISSPAPAAIPAIPQPLPVEAIVQSASAPAVEPAQSAKLAEVPPSAAVADIPKSKKSSNVLKPHGETKSGLEAMEGFDAERFEHVKATVAEMLEGTPDIDLDKLLNSLGEYSVNLDLDYLRENPHVLTDKLLEVQAKRDSLHAQILRLSPLVVSMRHASEYFDKVGTSCSTASSKDKRLAQVYFIISDFLVRASKVDRTHTNVEHTYKHLADQYELCSRLITGYQIKSKIGEISRGEMPFDPPYKIVPAAGKIQIVHPDVVEAPKPTLVAKATGTPPKDEVEDKLLSRELSQPVSAKKFENLDSFDSGSKPPRKTITPSINTGTVISDW